MSRKRGPVILADRIGLVVMLSIMLLTVLFPLGPKASADTVLSAGLLFGGTAWLLLRGLDFIVTGRVRLGS